MIRPPCPRATISLATRCRVKKDPLAFTPIIESQSLSGTSSSGA